MVQRDRVTDESVSGVGPEGRAAVEVDTTQLAAAYETVFEAVDDAAFCFDVDTDGDTPAFEFRWNNPRHRQLTGITVDRYGGAGPREILDDADADGVIDKYRTCVEAALPVEYDETLDHATGRIEWHTRLVPLRENGGVTRILGIAHDTTGRKEHERYVSTLHDATRRLIAAGSRTEIAEIAIEAVQALFDRSLPSVWSPTEDDPALELVATAEDHRALLEEAGTPEPTLPRGSPVWEVFRAGETVVRSPIDSDILPPDGPLRAAVLVPLGDHGVLSCAAPRGLALTDRRIEVLETLAGNVRFALDQYDQRRALQRQQRFTDDLLDALEDIVYVLDEQGQLLRWNATLEAVTGYGAGEIESMAATEFFPPSDTDSAAAAINEAFDTGRSRTELDLLTADGETIPFEFIANAFGTPTGDPVVAGIGRDRRRQVEFERRLSLAVDAAEAGIWEWDLDSDEVIWGDSMEAILGLDADAFGGSFDDFIARVHPDDREDLLRVVDDSLSRQEGFEREFRLQQESGDYVWILTRTQLVTDQDGRPELMVGVGIDVSERTDRTRQLDVMDRVLRHNLRNDMTLIQGWTKLIRSTVDGVDDETGRVIDKSQELMKTVDKEREIVDVIAEQAQQTDVDVAAVCRRVAADADEAFPEATIECHAPAESSAIATGKLERAIDELVENAIVHNVAEDPRVSLAVEPTDDEVRITIGDNGPGVPEKETNVLTREYEVEPLYHGSGLGLWLVNWIVKRAGGRIEFEDTDARGSEITIELERSS